MDGSVWVILPTYNEAENIEAVVGGIRAAAPEAKILVVDDNSRDGTGAIADRIADDVLHRPGKQGLGRAYIAGFARALEHDADYVVEMDADLSPRPRRPAAPDRARDSQGADLVLGSRYVHGGGVENWDLQRRVISLAGCEYARRVLGAADPRPHGRLQVLPRRARCGASTRAPRPRRATPSRSSSPGARSRSGLKIVEVPIRFRERRLGESKMSAQIALEAAWRVPALRYGPRRWRPRWGWTADLPIH